MQSIIINADDFGLTDGICRSVMELFQAEAISNSTVMICVEDAARRCKEFLDSKMSKRIGVHLQLTPENHHNHPISPASEIPSLVDSLGRFKPKDHGESINPQEVELEWDRQIAMVAEVLGNTPSHLDSHHGVHRMSELIPVYLGLASKYGIPVRGGNVPYQIDGSTYGVKTSVLSESDWTGQEGTLQELKKTITEKISLLDQGTLEIVTHPGFCDEDLMNSSTWNSVRENDHSVLLALRKEGWLEDMGLKLVSYPKM